MDLILAHNILEGEGKVISKEALNALYEAVGAQIEEESMNSYLSKVEGKIFSDMVEEGSKKMTISAGSAAPSAGVEKEEEKAPVEEQKEEDEDVDLGGFDLFG